MTKRTANIVVVVTATVYKSCSKTVNVAYIKKALPKYKSIFKPKSPRSSSHDWFLYKDDAVHAEASVQDFKWQRRCEEDPPPALYTRYCPNRLFSLSEGEDAAGWHLIVPGEPRRSGMGLSEPSPRTSPPPPFGGPTAARIPSELAGTRPKKSQNNGPLK
jgi:hypothetical protein